MTYSCPVSISVLQTLVLVWFRSYLTSRNFLAIDPVAQGVPQGPIFGLLLFHYFHATYYIAYYPMALEFSKLIGQKVLYCYIVLYW